MSASEKPEGTIEGHQEPNQQGAVLADLKSNSFPLAKTLVATLVIAFAAGFGTWIVAERFRVQEVVQNTGKWGGAHRSIPLAARNGGIYYGLLGAFLGLGLGGVSGLITNDRSRSRPLIGSVSGVILGTIGGLASSYALFPSYFTDLESADLTRSILIHLGIWAAIGAAAGIAFGLGTGIRALLARSLVGGVTGAAIGVLIFDVVGSMLPLAHTERPLSEEAVTRLAAGLMLVVCTAVGTVMVASQESRNTSTKL